MLFEDLALEMNRLRSRLFKTDRVRLAVNEIDVSTDAELFSNSMWDNIGKVQE